MTEFLRRWAVYLVVLAAVIGGGASSALEIVLSAAAWVVLPLFHAAARPAWLLPAFAIQAIAGAALVWGMRPLLWPTHWAEVERALPLSRSETRRSDLAVVTLGLVPLMLLYAVGALTLLGHDPAWVRPARTLGMLALVGSVAASIALGVALLQRLRLARIPRASTASLHVGQHEPRARALRMSHAGWIRALLWWPLWRGPARRTGHALLLSTAAVCLPAAGMLASGSATGWWLAAFAAVALTAVTRVAGLARREFAALREACLVLPLPPERYARGESALALAPLVPGLASTLAALPGEGVRPVVLAAYIAACIGACIVEVISRPADAAAKSSRWLFSLVLAVALASEVVP